MNYKILSLFLLLPSITLAQGFVPLVGIPGLEGGGASDFSGYVNAVYRLAISIAALIAVVKIIGAGVKYMFSDIVTSKSDAIKDIRGSLLGLLVVIGAVLILSTINEDLTNFQITLAPQEIEAPVVPACEIITGTCTGVGYTCINIPAIAGSSCTRIDFETNCTGENAELRIVGDEERCYMIDAATEATIITNLGPGIDPTLQASILQRTRDFLKTHLILDETLTAEIATENDAGEIIMAVIQPTAMDGFNNVESTIEQICTDVAEARGSETMGIVQGTTPSGTDYIACAEV